MAYTFGSYTSVYAGSKEFRRCMSSLDDKVDVKIAHIGRYLGFDDEGLLSDEAMKVVKVAQDYDCITIQSPPLSELEKRRQAPFFAKGAKLDFLLIVDSDEYIDQVASDWDLFRQTAIETAVKKYKERYNIFGIKVEDGPQTYRAMPRLWFKPHFIYYDRTHYGVKTMDPNCPFTSQTKAGDYERHPIIETLPHLTIRSDTTMRTDYHKTSRASYGYILNNLDNKGLIS